MWSADDGGRSQRLVLLGKGVGQGSGLRVGRNEEEVDSLWNSVARIANAIVICVECLMAQLAAPDRDNLRRDAGVLLGQDPMIGQTRQPALGQTKNVKDRYFH